MADDYALIGGAPGTPGSVPVNDNGHMHEGTAVKSLGDKTRYPDTEDGLKQVMRSEMDGIMGGAHGSLNGMFSTVIGTIGAILSGGVRLAGALFTAVVDGVVSLIGSIGQAFKSAWSRLTGGPQYDIPENFMPLEASAYEVLEPVKTGVDDALESARSAEAEMLLVRDELAVLLPEIDADVEESQRLAREARDQLAAAQESNDITQQVVADAVASAASSADLAQAKAQEAVAMADAADLILVEVRSLNTLVEGYAESAQSAVTDARAARDAASSSLSSAQGVLDRVEDAGGDVQALHTQVLGLHQETLTAHGEAIEAATDATGALADAVIVQQDITTKHSEVLTKHGAAIQAAASAAEKASEASTNALSAAQALAQTQSTHTSTLALHTDVVAKHSDAIGKLSNAVQLQDEATRLQALINRNTLTALEVHENLMKWRDATRVRLGSTTNLTGDPSPWTAMADGRILVRSSDNRNRVEFTAPGTWAGRVVIFATWETETITGDDYFTQHYYNVGPGARGTWFSRPKGRQNLIAVSAFVEPWWGMEKREFVIQVAGANDGRFIPTSAYDAPTVMVSFPTGQTPQPVAFSFDVKANHPVRAYSVGSSPVWIGAGSRIIAGRYIIPAHQSSVAEYPAVVKFTEM